MSSDPVDFLVGDIDVRGDDPSMSCSKTPSLLFLERDLVRVLEEVDFDFGGSLSVRSELEGLVPFLLFSRFSGVGNSCED
jgi:hypothetical protein